jgi:hypothetical protein
MFLEDCEARKTWKSTGDSCDDTIRQYALRSEQRAFTAMWMEELKDHLDSSPSERL